MHNTSSSWSSWSPSPSPHQQLIHCYDEFPRIMFGVSVFFFLSNETINCMKIECDSLWFVLGRILKKFNLTFFRFLMQDNLNISTIPMASITWLLGNSHRQQPCSVVVRSPSQQRTPVFSYDQHPIHISSPYHHRHGHYQTRTKWN